MITNDALLAQLLDVAHAAAKAGAKEIAKPLRLENVTSKASPGDLASHLDIAAERAIRSLLEQARPLDRLTGEELDDAGPADAEIVWSIDPLDGTTNRVKGSPIYATSIAARHAPSGRWLVGVVRAPDLRREYFAAAGSGAWLKRAGSLVRLHGTDARCRARVLGTGFSYVEPTRTEQLQTLPQAAHPFDDIRSFGSAALGLCFVADGALDAFVETDLFEYDWAAGALIAEEAGATVIRPPSIRGAISAATNTHA